ncbi:hypothetical protein ACHAWO_009273 [Cyclotella atomus]|uniref:Nucleoid-associated protein n=1 Tax=Cyclotella atomus TaxID=382360 RepID=A0ABD3Q4D5_9STRA
MKLLPVISASVIFLLDHSMRAVAFPSAISTRSNASRHTEKGRFATNTSRTAIRRYHLSSTRLFNWFQRNEQSPEGIKFSSREEPGEEELMHRTVKMMENHRRSQDAAERTASIMEELANTVLTGKSKAGYGAMGLGGSGVKVTFDGTSRPINVEVDPKFLFSSSESGVISVEDLNTAITEAMVDGYEQCSKLMEEKMKLLYEQLGLPKEGGK